MKSRKWTSRILWFLLGVVLASFTAFAMPSHSQPAQDCWQELASLRQRVAALEQYNQDREKADRLAAEAAAREERNKNRADRYR